MLFKFENLLFDYKYATFLHLVIIVGSGFLMHLSIIDNSFLSDDFVIISKLLEWDYHNTSFFRPLSKWSMYIDFLIWGLAPLGYYLSNIFLNILSSIFLYFLVINFNNIIGNRDLNNIKITALAVSLIFISYPYHNEAVAWIAGRGVLIASLFAMVSFNLYLLNDKGIFSFKLLLSLLFYFLSLFAYESVWTFPVIILISGLFFAQRRYKPLKEILVISCLYFLILGVYLFIRMQYVGTIIGAYGIDKHLYVSVIDLALNVLRFVSRSFIGPQENVIVFVALSTFLLILFSVLYVYIIHKKTLKKYFTHFLFLSMYFIALLPVLSLGIDTHDTESERFLYFPSFFMILSVVYFILIFINDMKYRVLILSLIFFSNIYFLQESNSNFRNASNITKGIIEDISSFSDAENLYCINIPDQYKGAFIFRNGLKEAINLYINPYKFENIIIISKIEVSSQNKELTKVSISDLENKHHRDVMSYLLKHSDPNKKLKPSILNINSSVAYFNSEERFIQIRSNN